MNKLLVIVGPTGTGKTKLALSLAKKFNGEVISADSRQLYKHLDIATGKEVTEIKKGIASKHDGYWLVDGIKIHLYDLIEPTQSFSVAQYQQQALEIIEKIQREKKLPILVGGTGLYVSAVSDGLNIPKIPPDLFLRKELEIANKDELYKKLQEVDPKTAEKIDAGNPHRLVRALEVFYQTGQSLADLKDKYKVDFDLLFIGLTAERENLYKNADSKVEEWLKLGLVEETKKLVALGYPATLTAMTSIGYQQIIMSLEEKISLAEASQRIKFALHNYIRRQLTWFKRDKRITWFDISKEDFEKEIGKRVSEWYN